MIVQNVLAAIDTGALPITWAKPIGTASAKPSSVVTMSSMTVSPTPETIRPA